MFGKQDPYVAMSMGPDWSHRTETHEGAGDKSTWSLPDVIIPVTSSFVEANRLKVKVKDSNDISSDKLIGKASVDGSAFISQPDVCVDVAGDLVDEDGNVTGHYKLNGVYIPKAGSSDPATESPASVTAQEEEAAPTPATAAVEDSDELVEDEPADVVAEADADVVAGDADAVADVACTEDEKLATTSSADKEETTAAVEDAYGSVEHEPADADAVADEVVGEAAAVVAAEDEKVVSTSSADKEEAPVAQEAEAGEGCIEVRNIDVWDLKNTGMDGWMNVCMYV
jgi:hypothetical protein